MDDPFHDKLSRFLIENTSVRGEMVSLDATWQAVLERQHYPPSIRDILGQAMGAVALMASTIKFDGSLILQIRGTGPLHMLVVQATAKHTMRGLARWRGNVDAAGLDELVGDGRMVITIDPGEGMDRYQSIIDMGGDNLAEVLERYFENSEQLPTRFWLAADEERCAGFLLQRLPSEDQRTDAGLEQAEQDWKESVLLAQTLRRQELLTYAPEFLLRKLFPDYAVRLFNGPSYDFRCGCSREVIETTLRALGRRELMTTLDEEGEIRVSCEFCNGSYVFDAIDVEQLFVSDAAIPADETRH